jgi:hypothetical protein
MKAFGNDLVPGHFDSFWSPDATNASPGMFDNLHADAKVLFHLGLNCAFRAAICPDY